MRKLFVWNFIYNLLNWKLYKVDTFLFTSNLLSLYKRFLKLGNVDTDNVNRFNIKSQIFNITLKYKMHIMKLLKKI